MTGDATPLARTVRAAVQRAARPAPDADLLTAFVRSGDPAAFAALVRRHDPLVLAACRALLPDPSDADDAAQAAFLVLHRKAHTVRDAHTLSGWLFRVARRSALEVRRAVKRRRASEAKAARPEAVPGPDLSWREACAILHEEIDRLPEAYRLPLIACYLEGKARDEVAAQLGTTPAAVRGRLDRGRERLRRRLSRRGVTLSAGLLAALAMPASGPVRVLAAVASPSPLVADVARAAAVPKLLWPVGSLSLAVALLAGVLAVTGVAETQPQEPPARSAEPALPKARARQDRFGDPLPEGAVRRLGTARHRAAGAHVAVTPDGKAVVTVGDDLVVRTFDANTGESKSVRTLDGPPTYHTNLSPDGRYLAGVAYPAPDAAELRVWDLASGKETGRLSLGREQVSALAVQAGGAKVAFVRGSFTFPPSPQETCVWDVGGGPPTVLRRFTPEGRERYGEPRSTFSPNGKLLLTHQPDGRFVCWDVAGARALWEHPLRYLKFFFFHPDGKHVVVSDRGSGFALWVAADGSAVPGAGWDGAGADKSYSYWPVAASPDGRLVACFRGQRQVALYDLKAKAIVRELNDPLRAPNEPAVGFWAVPTTFAFTPDGSGFVWRSPTVQRWDVATGKPAWPETWDQGHTEAVTRLLFSPRGDALLSAAGDGTFYVWDWATGRPRYRLSKGYGDLATFTPDGRRLIAAGGDRAGPLRVWDTGSGKAIGVLKGDADCPQYGSGTDREAAVTADGKRLVTLTDNFTGNARIPPGRYLSVWDLATRQSIREEQRADRVDTTVLAPGGDLYARFEINRPAAGVRLVATASGEELHRLADEDMPQQFTPRFACTLVFSPDGRLLATRLTDDTGTAKPVGARPIKVWDVSTGRELSRLPTSGPARFAFAPDGRTLAVAGVDHLRVYDLFSFQEAFELPTSAPPGQRGGPFATALVVGPGGRTAATGHGDGTILVWEVTPPRAPLKPGDGDAAWAALADPDARVAWAAVWRLADAPDLAVRLLQDRLKPATAAPAAAGLILRLDDPEFKVREKAERELRSLGSRAEPALKAALAGKPSAELRSRVEKVLAALGPTAPLAPDDRRELRAVQVLEAADTPETVRLLKAVAAGDKEIRLTREAEAALARMGGR